MYSLALLRIPLRQRDTTRDSGKGLSAERWSTPGIWVLALCPRLHLTGFLSHFLFSEPSA